MNSFTDTQTNSEEVIFNLSQDFEENYHEFFKKFDEMKEELQIKSYGVANTSLEQVFLKVVE